MNKSHNSLLFLTEQKENLSKGAINCFFILKKNDSFSKEGFTQSVRVSCRNDRYAWFIHYIFMIVRKRILLENVQIGKNAIVLQMGGSFIYA